MNFFSNKLFLQSVSINKWIWSPSIIKLFMPLDASFNSTTPRILKILNCFTYNNLIFYTENTQRCYLHVNLKYINWFNIN